MIPQRPWWTTISTPELLDLRRRLVEHVGAKFGASLATDLEDVVQRTFMTLFRRRESVTPDDDGLFRYLKTVAANAAVDRVRLARRRDRLLPEVISRLGSSSRRDVDSAAAQAESAEERDKVRNVFCALGELERLVIWSHVVEEKPIRTIARELGLNWHRVNGIVERVLRQIRQRLES